MRSNKGLLLFISVLAGLVALVSGMRHVSFTMSGQKGNSFVIVIGYVPGNIQISPHVHENDLHPTEPSSQQQSSK